MDELIDGSCSITKKQSSNEEEAAITLYHTQFAYQYPPFQIINYSEASDCQCMQHQQRSPFTHKRKNLISFDWDDTLFPTHSFRTHQHTQKHFMSKLKILVSITEHIFTEMIELYGPSNIIIVTNASSNWIHKCLNIDIIQNIFMKFQKLLKKHNIKIISASTDIIRSKYPTNYYKWKEVAFTECFRKHFNCNDKFTNCVTSIGDSLCEFKASDRASKYLKNRILNRVLLKSNPSIDDMISQLRQIQCIMDQFGVNTNDMDVDYSSACLSNSDTT
eukprot:458617_1